MSKPLTIDELKALQVGDWVWVEILDKENVEQDFPIRTYLQKSHGTVLNQTYFSFYRFDGICDGFDYSAYGTKWLAYKNKEQAETKGEWVELPCEVGDKMWLLNDPFYTADICEVVIEEIAIKRNGIVVSCVYDSEYCEFRGDFIFRTKEEAEARLKELRGEK